MLFSVKIANFKIVCSFVCFVDTFLDIIRKCFKIKHDFSLIIEVYYKSHLLSEIFFNRNNRLSYSIPMYYA